MNNIEINLISKEEFQSLKYSMLDWDVEVKGTPYQVIKVEGHAHCIGGHLDWGEGNNLWAYPLNETMTFENLIEFDGEPGATWGVVYEPTNYIKTKWGETEIRRGRKLLITRNGKPFYDGMMTFHQAIAYAKDGILDEHPLNLNSRDFDKKCIGRKVWYRSQPGVITYYCNGQACVIIEPDGLYGFADPPEYKGEGLVDPQSVKVEIFDTNIWWFRE